MAHVVHARLNAISAALQPSAPARAGLPSTSADGIHIAVYEDLAKIEQDWRAFEEHADGTVFQTVEWLSVWQRHVGERNGVRPAIVVGRNSVDDILFLLPLSIRQTRFARALEWFGSDLCDYNAPLLAAQFSERIGSDRFAFLWDEIARSLNSNPRLRYDFINLTKMPERVGNQPNPMLAMGVTANPSGAYLTHLEGTWDTFYASKRSSTTRRRDRTKRKRLSELGEVCLVNTAADDDILAALDTLMAQKTRAFARMGVANLFANPGYPEFYRALATDVQTRAFVHVSRLDVGTTPAAVNLGLIHRGRYYHLQASYGDGEAARFGPGAAHLHELMRHAIERGCDVFDFTIGDESYKRDWCDTELTLYDYISAATLRGALATGPMAAAQRLKRWIKQTPILWTGVSKARAFLGALRSR